MKYIELKKVNLDYPLPRSTFEKKEAKTSSPILGGVLNLMNREQPYIRALNGASLDIVQGDRVALIGHNGSGKTTLLRVMAGILQPSSGSVTVKGRVAPLFSLSFGLDANATGHENIVLRGLMLGMGLKEIEKKRKIISSISELGDYLQLPMRTYSSGMRARLAFAISTQVNADILLLDESIATGDAAFFEKTQHHISSFIESTNTVVLASHSSKTLRSMCTKGILLEHGRILATGPLEEVLERYRDTLRKKLNKKTFELADNEAPSSSRIGHLSSHTEKVQSRDHSKFLLMNDTSVSSNPGCRAVRAALDMVFTSEGPINGTITDTLFPDQWADSFGDLAAKNPQRVVKKPECFTRGSEHSPPLDFESWKERQQELVAKDKALHDRINLCDAVIVNGEGSIHHNSPRSLALLALCKVATEQHKPVLLLNSTIQAMSKEILRDVLPNLQLIHVRDTQSKNYLNSLGIECKITTDIAFLSINNKKEASAKYLNADRFILVTAGVTACPHALNTIFDSVNALGREPVYLLIGDGGEKRIAHDICKKRGVPLIDTSEIAWQEMSSLLAQFPFAISGRHHINIFLMKAGVPFVPLPSNTWKIEETLQMTRYPLKPLVHYGELTGALEKLINSRALFAQKALDGFDRGLVSIHHFSRMVKECKF